MQPTQYSTADGSLIGSVNGVNNRFTFVPTPRVLFYGLPAPAGKLLFRNGLLVDENGDYETGADYFALTLPVAGDTLTAQFFPDVAPTKMRLFGTGLTAVGPQNLRFSPQANPAQAPTLDFILFRNGLRLTETADYTVTGLWINLVDAQAIQDGDTIIALIDAGGTWVSTANGTITGGSTTFGGGFNSDQFNTTQFNSGGFGATEFVLPFAPAGILLWLNGDLLTEGFDYAISGPDLLIVHVFQLGDILTAQLYDTDPPVQLTNADGSLSIAQSAETVFFRNGLFQTPPYDGYALADVITIPAPQSGDIVTAESWVTDVLIADEPALNFGQLYTSANGGILGLIDGTNNAFAVNVPINSGDAVLTTVPISELLFFRNGLLLTPGTDYVRSANVFTMLPGAIPQVGDLLSSRVFF